MTARAVCDASALVAALLDSGPAGEWATAQLTHCELHAPHLVQVESANIMRRHEIAGLVSADQAAQAHADLLDLPVALWPYELFAHRAWRLRHNVTLYDGLYVALAEDLDAPLVTLDARVARAPDLRCTVVLPPSTP